MAYVFTPGVSKNATIPVNVSPAGLAGEVEIYLGPNAGTKTVTSGRKPFTSTGAQQNVSAPLVMPSPAVGTVYHVYIDLYAEGQLLAQYIATDDVIIPTGTVAPPVWS